MIKVRNLKFNYPSGDKPAVDGMDFEIADGEIFGFLGPNGAGKSTTQKILIGLLKNYSGNVYVFGKDLRDQDSGYYERIGVSFEVPNHYLKLTALENLEYFRSFYTGETENPAALLELVGLEADGDMPVSQFSRGMRNRLTFARALINRPELLFLDESTAGLDPVSAGNIKRIILDLKANGRTVFLTTHDMVAATELCDRVGFIIDGKPEIVDSPENLMLSYGKHTVKVEYFDNGMKRTREFPMENLGANEEFISLIKEAEIRTIHTQEATLESVFIQVTGRRLS